MHKTKLFIAYSALFLLIGLSFSDPVSTVQTDKASGMFLKSQKAPNLSKFQSDKDTDIGTAFDFPIDPDSYELGPGDKLGIDIRGQVYQGLELDITPQGGLVFPEIGFISVKGFTITGLEKHLNAFLSGKLKFQSIKLYLVSAKSQIIFVTGAVHKPGSHNLEAPPRLNAALKAAGLKPWGRQSAITIKAGKEQKIIDYFKYYATGDPVYNPILPAGAVVHVKSCQEEGRKIFLQVNSTHTVLCLPGEARASDLPLLYPDGFNKNTAQTTLFIKRAGNLMGVDGFSSYTLAAGDTVIVKPVDSRVYVSGQVQAPGDYDYSPANSVEQYVGMAGGETWRGNFNNFYVFRNGQKIKIEPNVRPLPGDVIYVPARKIPRINDVFGIVAGVTSIIITAKAVGFF